MSESRSLETTGISLTLTQEHRRRLEPDRHPHRYPRTSHGSHPRHSWLLTSTPALLGETSFPLPFSLEAYPVFRRSSTRLIASSPNPSTTGCRAFSPLSSHLPLPTFWLSATAASSMLSPPSGGMPRSAASLQTWMFARSLRFATLLLSASSDAH